jgi:hypothetical protein
MTCARAGIPTPERGYWQQKEAGKNTFQAVLTMRAPGMDEEVLVAGGNNNWQHNWERGSIGKSTYSGNLNMWRNSHD